MHGRTRSAMRVLGLCLCCGLATSLAGANPPPQGPSTAPDPTQPGKPHGDDMSRPSPMVTVPRIIVAPASSPTLEPVRPNVPPGAAQDLSLGTSPPLLREGAFVSNAKAQLVKGRSGRWYAIYDADATGVRLPPMIVMDNAYLGSMERVAGAGTGGEGAPRMRISGRVMVYRDRNFLLPTAPPIVDRVASVDPEAAANAASSAASAAASSKPVAGADKPAAKGGGEPSIEDIVADLDKAVGANGSRRPTTEPAATPTPTAVEAASGGGSGSADSGVTSGFLTQRRGRIVRGTDGGLMAVVDSGSSGKSEGPMTLLPCQNLAAIETIMDTASEGTSFTLTGEVYTYRGRRYLLPTMYTVNRSSDNINSAH